MEKRDTIIFKFPNPVTVKNGEILEIDWQVSFPQDRRKKFLEGKIKKIKVISNS